MDLVIVVLNWQNEQRETRCIATIMTHFCNFAVFCKSLKPHHRSTKFKRRPSLFQVSWTGVWCQRWLVPQTLVVLLATLIALNLYTGRPHVLWYEFLVARILIVNAKRYVTLIAFLKFLFFLLTARPTRYTRLSKSSFGNLKESWISITVLHLLSFRTPTYSSWLWHELGVGLSQECLLFFCWYL